MIGQIRIDGRNQFRNAFEGTTADTLVGDFAEPTLDQIQPGTGSWNEMQMEPGMPLEPGFHAGMFVSAVIVHD